MAVVLGALTDWPRIKQRYRTDQLYDIFASVGMRPFEPQDVSGWSLENVWTIGRLTKMHSFLKDVVLKEAEKSDCDMRDATYRLTRCDFINRGKFLERAAPYALEGPDDVGLYSMSVQVCLFDLFIS